MAEVEETSIIGRRMIRPSEKTWTGTMKLSEIDMAMARGFVPKLYVYRGAHKKDEWDPPSKAKTLEESLSKALVRFYPFMGRLRPTQGGAGVDDSDAATWGVPFVEAQADVEVADLGDNLAEAEEEGRLCRLFPAVYYGVPLHEMPLLTVQLTHFRCGGVAVAFAWFARGEPLGMAPLHDLSILRAGEAARSIPEFIQKDAAGEGGGLPPFSETTSVKLSLSKIQINKLKQLAGNVVNGRPYSRFEVLCLEEREKEGKKLNALGVSIDIRKRINPPLSQEFVGNAVINLSATSETKGLISNPLGHACSKIRQTLDKVTDDLVWSYMDYQKSVDDLGAWRGIMTPQGSFVNPDVMMVSWLNLSFYNLDFGWGNEVHMASRPQAWEGVACLLDGREDGQTVVVMCLQDAHVDKFK
ncbi:hypothetical protein V2J09_003442 [Rumex salicifolius]